jgi:hypothetical protein
VKTMEELDKFRFKVIWKTTLSEHFKKQISIRIIAVLIMKNRCEFWSHVLCDAQRK